MNCYASRTGTRRNLEALRQHGWGLMISRAGVWRTEGFTDIVGDNGAWTDFQHDREFDEDAYDKFLLWIEPYKPRWLVLPDIVAGGHRSLDLSIRYLNRCQSVVPLVLIAVQDGLLTRDLISFVGPHVGIFLGGSTQWKLEKMAEWGDFCAQRGFYETRIRENVIVKKLCHYHVARVNTRRRMLQALASGAESIDGSSATRYAVTTPKLTYVSRYRTFFDPRLNLVTD
jgi:hypothetical protein